MEKLNENEYQNTINCLHVELTRRCNMKCLFCARGEAENVDINKGIIDKIFDLLEKSNVVIRYLRLGGGEPMLNEDMFCYIIDEIIRRHILIKSIFIFTNGTIRSKRILDSIHKFVNYRHLLDEEGSNFIEWENAVYEELIYENVLNNGVSIIISEYGHTPIDIDSTRVFYTFDDPYYIVTAQTENFSNEYDDNFPLMISGLAEKNIDKLHPDKNKERTFEILDCNYNLGILRYKNSRKMYLRDTISVSANGNVYPGVSAEYRSIDEEPMFNIMKCDNFLRAIVDWAYKHPINLNANLERKIYKALLFCRDHGFKLKHYTSVKTKKIAENISKLSYLQENIALKLHRDYPTLDFSELDIMSALELLDFCYDNNMNNCEDLFGYLLIVMRLTKDDLKDATPEMIHKFIESMRQKDNERRKQGYQSIFDFL